MTERLHYDQEVPMRARGHSLWLMPEGETYDQFVNLIQDLAKSNNAPTFQPHVTLLGEVLDSKNISEKVAQLASSSAPFSIDFQTVDYQDFFFRALYAKAEKTAELQKLHDQAKEIFSMQNIPPYMPHLSLLYGNFPVDLKKRIIQEIGDEYLISIPVSRISLFKTEGEANEWYKIRDFPLK